MSNNLKAENLSEAELKNVQAGIGLLLPAVQAAREPARQKARSSKGLSLGTKETESTVKKA